MQLLKSQKKKNTQKKTSKLGIMEKVGTTGEIWETHYLPRHEVVRADKDRIKLRTVFDNILKRVTSD